MTDSPTTLKDQTYSEVQDSGYRQAFETGSVRDIRRGKGRYDLISPIALHRLARHYENGAVKYGDWNWAKGQPLSRYLDSALRHLNKFAEGHRDEDHLAAAAWNIFSLIHTEAMIHRRVLPSSLNDLQTFLTGPPNSQTSPSSQEPQESPDPQPTTGASSDVTC